MRTQNQAATTPRIPRIATNMRSDRGILRRARGGLPLVRSDVWFAAGSISSVYRQCTVESQSRAAVSLCGHAKPAATDCRTHLVVRPLPPRVAGEEDS